MGTTNFRDFVASKIQSAWRLTRARRAYLKRRTAAVVIQTRFRHGKTREKVRERFECVKRLDLCQIKKAHRTVTSGAHVLCVNL